MIIVHHLNESRSQRVLWLLEELQVPYDIRSYTRDLRTRLAPPELKAIHPLGKSPVITDRGRVIAESGAIVDYLIRHYGKGRLQPSQQLEEFDDYTQWMHYAEGSAMLPILLRINLMRLGAAAAQALAGVEAEIANHLGYIDARLTGRHFLMGSALTGADIQLSFVGELAAARMDCSGYPNMISWVKRLQARPAYLAALERGGPYPLVLK
jgi:glutathione S-transferase